MKGPTIFLSALFVFLVLSLSLQAAEIEKEGTPQRKLQRGFLNIALSPIEISTELAKEKKNETLPPSWVAGAGRGIAYMTGRALIGVYELVTFPVPYPAHYKPVLFPEFEWQNLPANRKS